MKRFPILFLTKADLFQVVEGLDNEKELRKQIRALSDDKMRWLATKLGEGYCSDDYWNFLLDLFIDIREARILTAEKVEE